MVEVYRDRALALPPLNTTLAHRMIEQTKILTALKGVRGRKPVNLGVLESLLVRFSQLVVEQPWISEIDINPLLASPDQLVALDARVVLNKPDLDPGQLPKPAIRPYPSQYVSRWTMKDGTEVTLRPIRPEDEPLMIPFHQTLSERTVYLRYFYSLSLNARVAHERLSRICFVDYDREMALIADRRDAATGKHQIIAVGRLTKLHGKNDAEVAVLVADQYQKHGLGTELLSKLIQVARDEKLSRMSASMLADNAGMQAIFRKMGFRLNYSGGLATMDAFLDL